MEDEKQKKLDHLFTDIADRISLQSHGIRLKVGCVIVKDGNIISMGWNGTPFGMDNTCEIEDEHGNLKTRPEVLHAESNALMKLAARGGVGAEGATLYATHSPCPECAKLIKQAKIARVVYRHQYRLPEGIQMLEFLGVKCHQLPPPEAIRETTGHHSWKDDGITGGYIDEYESYSCTKCGAKNWLPHIGKIEDLPKGPCVSVPFSAWGADGEHP